jgi:uncharacterized protein with ParB-like and HNH nuclease domain
MKYVNREMKVDQIIAYFNDKKINLVPPFQRGSVWKTEHRRRLIENMIQERPIPAIFLYKQESGSQFSYNILDGKQRLESLLLFVGNRRSDMKVENVEHHFYGKPEVFADLNFSIDLGDTMPRFQELDDSIIRRFREYAISTIEIDLDEERASFDEVVNLFIDINQKGVKVSRFDVVKALVTDRLFRQVFKLIARKKNKKRSTYYKPLNNSFVQVLKQLNVVRKLRDENSQVDRMWERLVEIAIFSKDGQHRAPAGILKSFIDFSDGKHKNLNKLLTEAEQTRLRLSFGFLADAYRHSPELAKTTLATDQPQFYTLITTLLSSDLLTRHQNSRSELEQRIFTAAQMIEREIETPDSLTRVLTKYRQASAKQTTHPSQRDIRQKMLLRMIDEADVR